MESVRVAIWRPMLGVCGVLYELSAIGLVLHLACCTLAESRLRPALKPRSSSKAEVLDCSCIRSDGTEGERAKRSYEKNPRTLPQSTIVIRHLPAPGKDVVVSF
eukprot:4289141-Amphidinium_carterae.1